MEHFIVNKKRTGRKWHVRFVFVFPEIVEIKKSARRDSNPRPQPWQGCTPPLSHSRIFILLDEAGDGNRTHVSSLEGWCSTIELHPHIYLFFVAVASTRCILQHPDKFVNKFFEKNFKNFESENFSGKERTKTSQRRWHTCTAGGWKDVQKPKNRIARSFFMRYTEMEGFRQKIRTGTRI